MADMMLPFPIKPATSSGVSHYARYGVGGYYSVNSDSDRQSIPVSRLESGTLVYVVDSGKYWKYSGSTWTEQDFAFSSDVSQSLESLQSTLNQKIEELQSQLENVNTLFTWEEYE